MHMMDTNFYYTVNGIIIHNLSEVPLNAVLQKHPRLCGGKGGFGSMLRAIGSQIEKTTNREMCRDLNGRRMRDVNNEKRLKEWLDNADARERERLESYLEKRRKRKMLLEQGPSAKLPFEEKSGEEQRRQIAEELQEAICEAFEYKKNLENQVKINVKPKKINLNIDSDVESSSSSMSSQSSPVICSTENDSIDNIEEHIDSNDIVEHVEIPKFSVEISLKKNKFDIDIQEIPSDSNDNIEEHIDSNEIVEHVDIPKFSEEIPLKKNKLDIDIQETPSENVSKKNECIKEFTYSPIDLNTVGSVTHLLTFGSDWIKNDLIRRGLKCGGTLMEKTQRLFSVKGLVEYPPNLLVSAVRGKRK